MPYLHCISSFEGTHYALQKFVRDCRQITFVTLNRFYPLSKKTLTPSALNGQYEDGENTNQNQIKKFFLEV